MFAVSKAADLNQLGQGGQLYWTFPFSKVSLVRVLLYSRVVRSSSWLYLHDPLLVDIYGSVGVALQEMNLSQSDEGLVVFVITQSFRDFHLGILELLQIHQTNTWNRKWRPWRQRRITSWGINQFPDWSFRYSCSQFSFFPNRLSWNDFCGNEKIIKWGWKFLFSRMSFLVDSRKKHGLII